MIQQINDMAGLSDGDGYFERGYSTGDATFAKARVRFTPRQVNPGIADDMNVAAAPIAVCVAVSVSLVGNDGQVLRVADRALVADASSHTWQANADTVFEPDAWVLGIVGGEITNTIRWAKGMTAAAASGLIAAVVTPVVVVMPPMQLSGIVTLQQYYALFTDAELASIRASTDPEVQQDVMIVDNSPTIDLANAAVVAGFDMLVDKSLITTARATRIKSGLPPA